MRTYGVRYGVLCTMQVSLLYRNDIYTNSRDAYKTWLSHGVTKEGRGEARKGNKKEKEKRKRKGKGKKAGGVSCCHGVNMA